MGLMMGGVLPPRYYGWQQGNAAISLRQEDISVGAIVTVRYNGNVYQEVSIVLPGKDVLDVTEPLHKYYTALNFDYKEHYIRIATGSGQVRLEYAGDNASEDVTQNSYIKVEAF